MSPHAAGPRPDPQFARARFLLSCAQHAQLPADDLPEVAFAGRSNAGKSSALNALCAQGGLARVSKTPGRTQLLNLFEVPGLGRLVDLPGYGYAEVPAAVRQGWRALVGGYLESRPNLRGVVLVMDVRHPLTDFDRQMLDWCGARNQAVHVLLTKSDKLGFGASRSALKSVTATIAPRFSVQLFSAPEKTGIDEARAVLRRWLSASPEAEKKVPGDSGGNHRATVSGLGVPDPPRE